MYKHLLVGCAILSSPAETYITYLAVRAGWENAQIATCVWHLLILKPFIRSSISAMLFHLISRNPNKDITLHVSANNPAMVGPLRFPSLRVPDPNPKSCSTIALVSRRRNSSSASTKTTLTHSRACPKMRSAYAYVGELVGCPEEGRHSSRALFPSRGASTGVVGAGNEDKTLREGSDGCVVRDCVASKSNSHFPPSAPSKSQI